MEIRECIKSKIDNNNRDNIVYLHPVESNELIAKYISAFSNTTGGIILFGVKDDGNHLHLKNSAFNVIEQETIIRGMLDAHVDIQFGKFEIEENHKLEYVCIKENKEVVKVNNSAFVFNISNQQPELMITKTVFMSYCQKDSPILNIIEKELIDRVRWIKISRDIRDVRYKESLSMFMQSIGDHDFIVVIISDQYLKSINCMYEMVEMMRDRKYIEKLLFVIITENDKQYYGDSVDIPIGVDLYSLAGQNEYIKYWKIKETEIREMIKSLDDPVHTKNHVEEIQMVKLIQIGIQSFMDAVSDRKGISLEDMMSSGFSDFISAMQRKD